MLRYYWFRLTDIALPLGVALEGVAIIVVRLNEFESATGKNSRGPTAPGAFRRILRGLLAPGYCLADPRRFSVAALHVGDHAVGTLEPRAPRSHRIPNFDDWREACRWVADSGKIPAKARFLVPRHAQTFAWYAGPSDGVNWKDVPQDAKTIVEWRRRIQDIYEVESPEGPRWCESLGELGAKRLEQLGTEYGAELRHHRTDRPAAEIARGSSERHVRHLCPIESAGGNCETASGCAISDPSHPMRAVVFDMDGLMFNTEDVYTLVGTELLRRRGCEFTAELKDKMMGLQPQPAFAAMIEQCRLADTWQELAVESNRLFFDLLGDHLAMMPGLLPLLDALERAGIPKAIGTSSSRDVVAACLRPFDLEGRFQFVLAAENIRHGKPHPGDLSDGGPAFRRAAGGDARAGRQPKRLFGGGRGRSVRRGRARRTQPGARFQLPRWLSRAWPTRGSTEP